MRRPLSPPKTRGDFAPTARWRAAVVVTRLLEEWSGSSCLREEGSARPDRGRSLSARCGCAEPTAGNDPSRRFVFALDPDGRYRVQPGYDHELGCFVASFAAEHVAYHARRLREQCS